MIFTIYKTNASLNYDEMACPKCFIISFVLKIDGAVSRNISIFKPFFPKDTRFQDFICFLRSAHAKLQLMAYYINRWFANY